MKYAYYSGCALHASAREFDASLRGVFGKLGIELKEPDKWICCGSTPAHALSKLLGISLPWQNLVEIEKLGLPEVVVPCASCFARFKTAQEEVKHDGELAGQIEEIVNSPLPGGIKVTHPVGLFATDNMLEQMPGLVKRDFSGLKIACYYGCLLTRPPKVMQFDNCEYPQSMAKLRGALGIETVDSSYKTECCGATLSLTRNEIALKLCSKILEDAKQVGANGIAVACPLCHSNLDIRQKEIEEKYGKNFQLPIFYFSQLMGLAMGISYEELGLDKHFVKSREVIEKCLA